MTNLTTDHMDMCENYSREVARLKAENKELGLEVHALWETQNQLEAENAALQARVKELETPDEYFISSLRTEKALFESRISDTIEDACKYHPSMTVLELFCRSRKQLRSIFILKKRHEFLKFNTREEAQAALEALKNG